MSMISQKMSDDIAMINREMAARLDKTDPDFPVLADAMRYSAQSGGKRIRPLLTLYFCRLFGGKDAAALPFACAIEMIHTYSLIHDDLPCMDNDDYRRGQLTNHKKFGYANALLAGDALLTMAFQTAAKNEAVSPEQIVQATLLLSSGAGAFGMVGGQVMDLIGDDRRLTRAELEKTQRLKTGCLIAAACLLGATAAGVSLKSGNPDDVKKIEAVKAFASGVGLAFQIEDDILDLGEENAKTTFMSYLTVEQAREEIHRLTDSALAAIAPYPGNEDLIALARMLTDRTK